MWRLKDLGYSARAIGRAFGRDHHSVLRALCKDRAEDLVYELALRGRCNAAREMATRIVNQELRDALERLLPAAAEYRQQEIEGLLRLIP